MSINQVFALLLVSSGMTVATVDAWGPEGHRIVAHIAEQRLSDAARSNLVAILLPTQQISDSSVCNWPDYIRKDQPESGPWHYVNIPYAAEMYDATRDCPNAQCLVGQIPVWQDTLANTNATQTERHRALCFLVHMIGDLHQPLHCADRDGDRGGNLRTILYSGLEKETNLHAVWDKHLLVTRLRSRGSLEYADRLHDQISMWQAHRWAKGGVVDWANESHAVAVSKVYAGIPPTGGPPFPLDQAYIRTNQRTVDLQLKKGGIRLAEILNQTFP